jgi:predicted transposase/invertase (TIGR01784 family)
MRTDTLFYEIFQTQPELLFTLLGQDTATIADYDFRSVEVKQTAFRIDGLLIPKRNIKNTPVYLSEVQFQKDPHLYHRFFAEVFTYLKQYPETPSWQGILIYPRRSLIPPKKYWNLYQYLLDSPQVVHIYLEDLQNQPNLPLGLAIIQLIIEPKSRAKPFAKSLVQRVNTEHPDSLASRKLLDLIETILVYKFGSLTSRELEAMFGLSELKKTRVFQEGLSEGREKGLSEGLAEGREEGLAEGREEGREQAIVALLERRFTTLDPTLIAIVPTLAAIPLPQALDAILEESRDTLVQRYGNRDR